MAIDKALNQAPLGLSEMVEDMEPAIEIEIEDPESISIKAGDLEIVLEKEDMDDEFNENLAENLDDDVLTELAGDLTWGVSVRHRLPQRLGADVCRWPRASWP
jgi:hypothetical protein